MGVAAANRVPSWSRTGENACQKLRAAAVWHDLNPWRRGRWRSRGRTRFGILHRATRVGIWQEGRVARSRAARRLANWAWPGPTWVP